MISVHVDADGSFEVWSDTEVAVRDGRCIGLAKTLAMALQKARHELAADLAEVDKLIAKLPS